MADLTVTEFKNGYAARDGEHGEVITRSTNREVVEEFVARERGGATRKRATADG